MNHKLFRTAQALAIALPAVLFSGGAGSMAHASVPAAQPIAFANPEFQKVWNRTDSLVASGQVSRSYYWGPQPNTAPIMEDFKEGPGGKHLVQYFDKSRMEINNPDGDKSSPFYVTTGLLTLEMVSGYIQNGMYTRTDHYRAEIPVAGDIDDQEAPTYATLRFVQSKSSPGKVGEPILATLNRAGTVGSDGKYAQYDILKTRPDDSDYHLTYTVPDVFWQFLNLSGPVMQNGSKVTARLSEPWFYVTGYPIADAYWVNVKIDGKPTDVLIQPYERRVLTYVPSFPAAYRVQMGNIGQHYYDWRYNGAGKATGVHCTGSPSGKIGEVWSASTAVQLQLGCPLPADAPGTGYPTTIAIQHFEHGYMIDVIVNAPAPGPPGYTQLNKQIYVMYEDGTETRILDTFDPKQSQPTPSTPPTGLYEPQGGFGKAWRETQGVRERLGWATGPETTPQDATLRYFEHGFLVDAGAAEKRVYAIYTASGLSGSYDSWVSYDYPSH